MASLAQLIVKVSADSSDFTRGIAKAQDVALKAEGTFSAMGSALTKAAIPFVAFGGVALKQAADFDSLDRALEATAGSADKAAQQLGRLKEVAKLPGLGLKEAIQGSINLQQAKLSAETSERALKAFGNALATVGKGKNELDGVITALSQIQSKGKVSAEEINQLAERLPQIRVAMQNAFGTANTEDLQKLGISSQAFIEKIITEFEKLPPVTGGLKNSFENFRDTAEQALSKVGNAIAPFATTAINAVDPLIVKVGELGTAFSGLPEPIKNVTVALAGLLIAVGPISTIVGKFQELKVAALAVANVISGIGIGGIAGALGVGAIVATKNNLSQLEQSYASAEERGKSFQERLKDPEFVKKLKEQASGVGDLGIRIGAVGQTANVTADQLKLAFAQSGVKSIEELRAALQKAQTVYQTVQLAVSQGVTSHENLVLAQQAVKKAQEDINAALGNNIEVWRRNTLAEQVGAASLDRMQGSFQSAIKAIDAYDQVGTIFGKKLELQAAAISNVDFELQQLQTSAGATARIFEGLSRIDAIKPPTEAANVLKQIIVDAERLRQTLESIGKVGIKIEPVKTDPLRGTVFETEQILGSNSQIALRRQAEQAGQDLERLVELRNRDKATQADVNRQQQIYAELSARAAGVVIDSHRAQERSLQGLGRSIKATFGELDSAIASSLVSGRGFADAFVKLSQDIGFSLIRYTVNQGLALVGKELSKLSGVLGGIGRQLADLFGVTSGSVAKVAGVAGQTTSAGASTASSVAGSVSSAAAGGLAGAVSAVSGVATAIFSALQFTQLRRIEQDIGRIEVSARGSLSQSISIQGTLNQYLPLTNNLAFLPGIDAGIRKIYEGLGAVTFSGGSGLTISGGTFNFQMPQGSTADQMEAIADFLKRRDRRFTAA